MSAEKISYDDHEGFDPVTASTREVIGWFLSQTEAYRNSEEAARYAAALLSVKDTEGMGEEDRLLHTRLRAIVIGSDVSDSRWEDDDTVAKDIYKRLQETKLDSRELADQRKALWRLLELRGADIKSDEDTVGENENMQRWNAVVNKIGAIALR